MKLKISVDEETGFYGHGKLMLTGEYFVLDGAWSLALPVQLGQHLRTRHLHARDNTLYWVALDYKNNPWLSLTFDKQTLTCLSETSPQAKDLGLILSEARQLNPAFLTEPQDTAAETRLEFPNNWGLGSSSTLIHTIACWAGVDPFQLLQNTLGGSGYDIACAGSDTPLLYQLKDQKPQTLHLHWEPPFADQIFFAHLGVKQSSPEAIRYYREQLSDRGHIIEKLDRITRQIIECRNMEEFEFLTEEHEQLVGASLRMMKIRDTRFSDYEGCVKSLGAWGGDFVMLTYKGEKQELMEYLAIKNINVCFSWRELILPLPQRKT